MMFHLAIIAALYLPIVLGEPQTYPSGVAYEMSWKTPQLAIAFFMDGPTTTSIYPPRPDRVEIPVRYIAEIALHDIEGKHRRVIWRASAMEAGDVCEIKLGGK